MEKLSFNIVTENTIIKGKGMAYLNNCGRHINVDIEDDLGDEYQLSIDIVTGRKTLYDINRKKYIIDFNITE